jgi:hypothetical protein
MQYVWTEAAQVRPPRDSGGIMKVLKREKITPINMGPSDSITLTYDDGRTRKKLLTHYPAKTMVIDEVLVFELAEKELKKLGLSDAIGGLFGSRDLA